MYTPLNSYICMICNCILRYSMCNSLFHSKFALFVSFCFSQCSTVCFSSFPSSPSHVQSSYSPLYKIYLTVLPASLTACLSLATRPLSPCVTYPVLSCPLRPLTAGNVCSELMLPSLPVPLSPLSHAPSRPVRPPQLLVPPRNLAIVICVIVPRSLPIFTGVVCVGRILVSLA